MTTTPPSPILDTPPPALRQVETAPSATNVEGPTFARFVGFAGLFLLILGLFVVVTTLAVGPRMIGVAWGYLFAAGGVALMLYHAVSDPEQEVRRMYGMLAAGWLVLAVGACALPGPVFDSGVTGEAKKMGFNMLPWGVGFGTLGLLFLMPFARHETDPKYRNAAVTTMLGVGGLLAVGSIVAGVRDPDFLAGKGIALGLLGLGFLCAYMGQVDTSDGLGYKVAFAVGAVGALVVVYAVVRSIAPTILFEGPKALRRPNGSADTWKMVYRGMSILACLAVAGVGLTANLSKWLKGTLAAVGLGGAALFVYASFLSPVHESPKPFLVPGGMILMSVGLIYLGVSAGICSDNQFITLTRRELSAYFLSPIGYLVLGGMAVIEWGAYWDFVGTLADGRPVEEPIVRGYFVALLPVFAIMLEIPALTMRLLSEEKRTGSLEVLLTAPVNEGPVVVSKFLATWLFFLISWLPGGLFLIALRVETDTPFDYRPLLSFYACLAAQGLALIAIGLFFSTLTKNQIVAAVFMFVAMMFFVLLTFLVKGSANAVGLPTFVSTAMGKMSIISMWQESLSGQLPLRDVLLMASLGVFFLFLSVKVLETRKWN